MIRTFGLVALACAIIVGCSSLSKNAADTKKQVGIEHIRYELDNGLTVILHQDTSDPLVHVDVTYHVGSSREVVGRSGFAHFFEHMMFQGSQNVADEQHFAMITEAGGDMNGTTNSDRTNYYQTVPRNHLEKVLWLESDRMGYLLPAVTVAKFENQRDTVKNERAQRVDNQPYGLRSERTSEALYPVGHPYSWPVIGYVEDLDRVGVDDLKAFFKRWYGPNNAVLTIGGDIDVEQTKTWIEQYFGPIPRGPEVQDLPKTPVTLAESRYLTLEDNVHLPFLQMTFPTVHARHPDEAPLDVLADILGGGKTSIFYKNLVVSGRTVQAAVSHPCRELACEFQLLALANPGVEPNLNDLHERFQQTFAEFEQRGVQPDDLERVKMSIEASTIFSLQSVASKVSMLAYGQTFAGEPDLVQADIDRYNAVTAEDVMRVYEQYIKNKPSVVLSIVPMQQTEWAVAKPQYEIPARDIPEFDAATEITQSQTEEAFDRSQIPPEGEAPIVSVPDFWQTQLLENVPLLGVTTSDTPTVSISISLEGGPLLDPIDKAGLASMTALMMNESTTRRSNVDIANELSKLGSRVQFSSSGRFTTIYVSSISKNLPATLDILYEKLFTPAFLEVDFNQLKQRSLQAIQQQMKNPNALASRAQSAILYGDENRVSMPDGGTYTTLSNIQLDDVKAFHARFYNPAKANVVVVGDIEQASAVSLLAPLQAWTVQDYEIPTYSAFPEHSEGKVFLVDKPRAVQSVVSVVRRSMPYDATGQYFRARLMNFPLGGHFNSRINLNLREEKGYTYGANSYFSGGKTLGIFAAGGDFNAPNTLESIKEILREMTEYKRDGISAEELALLKSAYTQGDALDYETPAAKARFLRHLLIYELNKNFSDQQLAIIQSITAEEINLIANELIRPQDMHIIVVGDAATLEPQLAELDKEIVHFNVSE